VRKQKKKANQKIKEEKHKEIMNSVRVINNLSKLNEYIEKRKKKQSPTPGKRESPFKS